MKKIIFFLRSFNPGGIERVLINLCNDLANTFEVFIVVVKPEGELFNNVKISEDKIFNLNGVKLSKSLFKLNKILKTIKPDIILTGGDISNCIVVLEKILFMKNLKVIISQHNYNNSETKYMTFLKPFISFLYKKSDVIIAVSRGIKEYLLEDFKIDSNKIKVIYNPIDIKHCHELADDKLCVNVDFKNEKYFLFCGRLTSVKNLYFLIKVFNLLQDYDYKLLICGDGPERLMLANQVKDLNIQNKIIFTGAVSNVMPLINNCVAGVLPSTSEAFPMFALELLALGKPLISTPTKGCIEICNDDTISFISKDFDDIESFKELFIKVINTVKDLSLKEKLMKRAKDFDKENILSVYKDLIDKI